MDCRVETSNSDETVRLARRLGERLRGSEIIELVSDLGGGKTTFVRGLAAGFGSQDKVASPTFTVSKVYRSGKKELHHFDFYRLSEPGVVIHELHDLLNDPDITIVIEWAESVRHVLPTERLTVTLTRTGDEARQIDLACSKKLTYLLEGLC